jgi:hypothetical protein
MKNIILIVLFVTACSTHKNQKQIYTPHLAPEGDLVMLGNPEFAKYIENKLSVSDLSHLETDLGKSLEIPVTERGFVQAANRSEDNKADDTNYDAVWVRDSVWVYFSFLERGETEKARKVLLALWDYYSSKDQQARFLSNIKNPALALDGGMNVPHIRFNGNDPEFKDVMKDGKPEEWNHRQNDAHGLFLLGIAQGHAQGLLTANDFTPERKQTLNLFVPYFAAINYWDFPDAGAWEEISKVNTSSVAMVVKALENSDKLVSSKLVKWNNASRKKLIEHGYARIRKNLSLGGESPDHDPYAPEYRREDAALFNLFLPFPLKQLTDSEKLLGLTILEKLIRPYGVIRYPLDSYQSGNYWIKDKSIEGLPELTGDSSSSDSFKARFRQFIPSTEAQWFFDSKLSMIYLQFASKDKKYLRLAQLHFKRALGQVTPATGTVLAADGKPVMNLAFPESINVLVKKNRRTYVPSPITPLNWAKASFGMALVRLKKAMH